MNTDLAPAKIGKKSSSIFSSKGWRVLFNMALVTGAVVGLMTSDLRAQVPAQQIKDPDGVSANKPSVASAATPQTNEAAKPIEVAIQSEPLEKRLARKITFDIRDMNIVDVVKFLAVKGDFNVITISNVEGRATLLLKSVAIKDALDIALISNKLAYYIQNEIVHVMTDAEYIAMFGKSFSDKRQIQIIHLNYAKPSYVLSALDGMKSNIGKIIIDEDTGSVVLIDTAEAIDKIKTAISSMEQPLETIVYNLQYAKAEVLSEKLRARIDANTVGSITANERSNQLIIRAFPARREEIEGLVKSLDTPTKEVLVEAMVWQVKFAPRYDQGIDWQLDFKGSSDKEISKIKFNNVFLNESKLSSSDNLSSIFGKIGVGKVGADHFLAAIRALKQVSDTKILSNPRILVTNNEEAKIHIGDTIPYIISTTSGTGDNAITSEDVRFVDVGLKLNVTPTINDDGYVSMRLAPEISTVTGTIASKGGGIPQVNKTQVQTTVLVKDGTTIIMGGLKKDEKTHSRTTDSVLSTEIVIFITPHIVKGSNDYDDYKGEIKPWKVYDEKINEKALKTIKKESELQTLKLKD